MNSFVWGHYPTSPVFLVETDAQELAQTWKAIATAATWKELREALPPSRRAWVEEKIIDKGWLREDEEEDDEEELTDDTDVRQMVFYWSENELYPAWPCLDKDDMYERFKEACPRAVQDVLEQMEEHDIIEMKDTGEGYFYEINEPEQIQALLIAAGCSCRHDQQLIDQASGPIT